MDACCVRIIVPWDITIQISSYWLQTYLGVRVLGINLEGIKTVSGIFQEYAERLLNECGFTKFGFRILSAPLVDARFYWSHSSILHGKLGEHTHTHTHTHKHTHTHCVLQNVLQYLSGCHCDTVCIQADHGYNMNIITPRLHNQTPLESLTPPPPTCSPSPPKYREGFKIQPEFCMETQ